MTATLRGKGSYPSSLIGRLIWLFFILLCFYRARYGHSPVSFKKLWQEVFRALEGDNFVKERVVVEAGLGEAVTPGRGDTMMWWSVVIL